MDGGSITGAYDLEKGVGIRGTPLQLDGQGGEKKDLNGSAWYGLLAYAVNETYITSL